MSATEMPELASAEPGDGLELRVRWKGGTAETVDLSPAILSFKVYRPLRDDPALFRSVRLEDDGATLVWTDEIDMPAEAVHDLARQGMTNAEFRAFLDQHRLTFDAAAAVLGISRRQVAYFAADKPVSRTVALACRGYAALKAA